ncbi:MAG TPA: hypothetical protein VEF04_19050, partial [Blastocatellia bacterium]|nr:hypothetical protein [Blastocatellia bacterium]
DPAFHIDMARVFVLDEVAVSNSEDGVSAGNRAFGVGCSKPFHRQGSSDPHITAVPLVNMARGLICNTFIVGAPPTVAPNFDDEQPYRRPPPYPANCRVVFNSSGSSEVSDEDGLPGSWALVAEHIITQVTLEFGPKERRPWFLLILDGFAAHKEHIVLETFITEKIHVMINAPNATHIVQIGDHPRMNGKAQQYIRANKARVRELLPVESSLEETIIDMHRILSHAYDRDNALQAARDIGFSFIQHNGRSYMGVTDETVNDMLEAKIATGQILNTSVKASDSGLRDASFLAAQELVAKGALPIGTKALITEDAIRATKAAVIAARLPRPSLKPTKERRRNAQELFDEGKPGTYLATGEKAMAISASKLQAKKDAKAQREAKAEAAKQSKLAKSEEKLQREARLKVLSDAMPGVDLKPHERSISRYLTGKNEANDLTWAIAKVATRLGGGVDATA